MYMISVSKALSILIKNRFELDVRTVELKKAVGNILAEDLISKITLPPFPVSAMDGYAVRVSDIKNGSLKR